MKLLSDIIYKVRLEEIIGSTHMAISSVTFDSRTVKKDSLFIATKGTAVDGHQYIDKATLNNITVYPTDSLVKAGERLKDIGDATKLYDKIWNEIKSK